MKTFTEVELDAMPIDKQLGECERTISSLRQGLLLHSELACRLDAATEFMDQNQLENLTHLQRWFGSIIRSTIPDSIIEAWAADLGGSNEVSHD